ncbi:MAG TPA: hypothetical protein VNM69_06455 [Bacillus sp. (in: firmicutes)]|nr:hypothetical protein [Bacillus sp. (in: firmicutes)]
MKKLLSVLCLFSFLTVGLGLTASPNPAHAGIKEDIQSESTDTLTKQADSSGSDALKIIRQFAIVVVIVVLAWIGFVKFFSGDSKSLADMKGRLGVLIIALLFAFKTEMVAGSLFKLFGVDFSKF